MKDYYKILNIENNIENNNKVKIQESYKREISRFKNLPFLTKMMIKDIKDIKEACYVLSIDKLRNMYINKLNNSKPNKESKYVDNTKICDRLFSITFT